MSELKPCPFCGSSDVSLEDQSGIAWVVCSSCNAEGPTRDVADDAIAHWNKRTAVDAQE